MTARAFEVSMIVSETERIVRTVVAHGSVQAMLTALRTLGTEDAPLTIICKPLCALAEEATCVA